MKIIKEINICKVENIPMILTGSFWSMEILLPPLLRSLSIPCTFNMKLQKTINHNSQQQQQKKGLLKITSNTPKNMLMYYNYTRWCLIENTMGTSMQYQMWKRNNRPQNCKSKHPQGKHHSKLNWTNLIGPHKPTCVT